MENTNLNFEPADKGRVSIQNPEELKYWSERFKVNPEQLQEAFREASNDSVSKIEASLVSLGYLKHTIT